jgi:predicted TPR repeat methyltransferase
MADAPDSNINDLDADASIDALPDPLAAFQADLDRARELIIDGDRDAALKLCLSVLDKEDLPIRIAATLSLIMRDLNQTRTADHIREVILRGLTNGPHQIPKTTEGLLDRAEILADLQAFDQAEDMCRRALEIDPDNFSAINALCAFLGHRGRLDEAKDQALAFCERGGNNFDSFMYFATIFGHLESRDAVKLFLDKAQKQCTSRTQQAKLDHMRAANGEHPAELDQHGMAVGIFDTFAENYDAQLAKIKNNGPSMIYTALVELDLPKTQTRRILDAGCGTGLCAGFLRQYAKEIVGADLSTKMLEKAHEKQLYDFLSRTDLAMLATFPEGGFDMIVCADVLVYFGALNTVFANFQKSLKPGGWLLLTVETEPEDDLKTGFKLHSAGRYKHTDAYVRQCLTDSGFPKPKLMEHGRLRNEMARPVLGTIVAVQKPALVFA